MPIRVVGSVVKVEEDQTQIAQMIVNDIKVRKRDLPKSEWHHYEVKQTVYEEIKRLAKEDYEHFVDEVDRDEGVESFYQFEVVKELPDSKIEFRVL